ncbi:hypothetical protein CXG81DRAFT_10445 [Caulochytrium protostelioides]|uniref:Large ribosomal subunit protein uL5 C-terminal domain-containing protein n=1 Tax=Caulochytrium protostelioides TaxID=1555241 RepID=A0A4P9XBI0_9FUNG|nr:hypothetical protein CXG81DRAFT_10445 [Caulochytrium protostelioides]|eukprot:RKP02735.1 hypothetical protein CXG81DRAFT_10445 [Caulochytrium protostelioides]
MATDVASAAADDADVPSEGVAWNVLSRSRLQAHYYDTLVDNLAILSYDATAAAGSPERLQALADELARGAAPSLQSLFSTPLAQLPTRPTAAPVSSELLHTQNMHPNYVVNTRKTKPTTNLIDYTSIPVAQRDPLFTVPDTPPFDGTLRRVPMLRAITLESEVLDAIKNKNILYGTLMTLSAIGGAEARIVPALQANAQKQIRVGMPIGATATLHGERMYDFVDKLVQCVLPRIREYTGIEPVGDGLGTFRIVIPASSVGYFPDIEPYFEMFPRLDEVSVTFHTTAWNDREAMLLLSGFQLPFRPEVTKVEAVEVEEDPWAKFKKKQRK